MNITITAEEAIDKGIWDEVCELRGWNVWAVNEGLMDKDEVLVFTKEEARKLGLV